MPEATNNDIAGAAPTTLNHIVASGENALVKQRIQVALDSAFATGEPFPHTLLAGGSGIGKTLLSNVISYEMGQAEPTVVLGQTLDCGASLNGVLLGLGDRQVLVIDEIHTLDYDGQHVLLQALENREIFLRGSAAKPKPTTIKLNQFTLIGASTDEHVLLPPLLDRFRLVLRLSPYGSEELVAVLKQRARTLRWGFEDDVLLAIAQRARGTPRIALRILESVRRTATASGSAVIRIEDATRTFELEGLDASGLTKLDRDYLSTLFEAGGPVRLNVLSTRLMVPPQSIVKLIESHLIREGFVIKNDGGRMLTDKGIEYARSLP